MYHFEFSCGASPDLATVKEAPLESYVGLPCGVKESEAPEAKSIATALPSAVFGEQLPETFLAGLSGHMVCALQLTAG